MSNEELIKLAAKLYECRDSLIRILGRESYLQKIVPHVEMLNRRAAAEKAEVLHVAFEFAAKVDGFERMWVLAAAVEATEPLQAEVPA